MSASPDFHNSLFSLPKDRSFTPAEAEEYLLEQFRRFQTALEIATWDLVNFFSLTHRPVEAIPYVERLCQDVEDPEKKARVLLSAGQLSEQLNNYNSATAYYAEALALEPSDPETWYFINNNLGFCLNLSGRFHEAESFCREAIRINPDRHNAYKNLGISLSGQGRPLEAVDCFIDATTANPMDARALRHLEALLAEQPWILEQHPEIQDRLNASRNRVSMARKRRSGADASIQ